MAGVMVRDLMVRVCVGAGLLVMLSACQTSKHTEVMGTEDVLEDVAVVPDTPEADQGDSMGKRGSMLEESPGGFGSDIVKGLESSDIMADAEPMEIPDSGDMTDRDRMEQDAADFGFSHVFFAYDKYSIDDEATRVLQGNARMLKGQFRDAELLIEGHCDERGTVDYNLELGKRRAQAVKDYLVDLGVSESRIRIVSYGKEKPFCMASEPACWEQNRRGHFLLFR